MPEAHRSSPNDRDRGLASWPSPARAVALAAVGATVALLIGCAGGGGVERDRGLERNQGPRPSGPQQSPMHGTTPVRLASASEVTSPMHAAVAEALLGAALATDPADDAEDNADDAFTLDADDRLDWQPTRLGLPLGQIAHRPTYLSSRPVDDRLASVRYGPVDSRLEAALESAQREPLTLGRAVAVPVETARFSLEALLLPVKVVLHPPTARDLTPKGAVDPRVERPRAWQRHDQAADDVPAEEAAGRDAVPVAPVLPAPE